MIPYDLVVSSRRVMLPDGERPATVGVLAGQIAAVEPYLSVPAIRMTLPAILSRVGSGWLADRIGGLRTLLLGSTLQAVSLFGYLVADGLASLYIVSALFGLFQGGIIPSYGVIVREYFSPREAGARMGIAISITILGMAAGAWMGGVLFDLTGSYRAAFLNGIAWNILNAAIAVWLLMRQTRRAAAA